MEMARMSCERPTREREIQVVVQYPKTLRERCRECCNGVARPFVWSMHQLCGDPCLMVIIYLCIALVCLMGVAIFSSPWWMPALMAHCQSTPGLDLTDVNVHAMNVYQNNSLPGTPYQANSDITLQLRAWNKNTVAKCFTTFRRVAVSVDFKGQRLVRQVVPLEGFGLKPRESRTMTLELKGENAPLRKEIGSLLALEVGNASVVELTLSVAARYMRNDRKASWTSWNCDALTKAPPTSTGGLVYKVCT